MNRKEEALLTQLRKDQGDERVDDESVKEVSTEDIKSFAETVKCIKQNLFYIAEIKEEKNLVDLILYFLREG